MAQQLSLRPPELLNGASGRALATAGWTVVSLHFLLLAVNHWILLDQFRAQIPAPFRKTLAQIFIVRGMRDGAGEVMALTAGAWLTVQLRPPSPDAARSRRIVSALLLSYLPVALHSMGLAAALLGGWRLDIWIASSAGATPQAIAATLNEAVPVVMEPLARARDVVNAFAAITLGALLRQACGFSAWRAAGAALGFAAVLTLARGL